MHFIAHEFVYEKSFLCRIYCSDPICAELIGWDIYLQIARYDHFAEMLAKILEERPENPADIIENISKDVKCARFQKKMDTLRDEYEKLPTYDLAEMFKNLFQKPGGDGGEQEMEEETVSP